ncbi:hypothetical protein HPB49_012079 [Dermacentor silvarum]|uniref:Uncharacterized protein n=1 Tax=Dermacentor silvarum TaxID=543639 RepID=A0ACB8E007_DERSI|nr:hypothetical protein HPB49_012079 [Dermacentor silvarum]
MLHPPPPSPLLCMRTLSDWVSEASFAQQALRSLFNFCFNGETVTDQDDMALVAADPLTVPNFQLAARIYQATPPNTCRGVIHDITPKTSSAVLMGNLWDPDSGILTARMMGSTHTALITFSGSHIPRWVNYRSVMVRCAPYRPRAQFCTVFSGLGHHADVCPNTEVIKCLTCGLTLDSQNQPHTCRMGCLHCGGNHQAGDPRCEVRAAAHRALRETEYARRLRLRVPAKDLQKVVEPSSQQQFIPLTTSLTQVAFVADSSTSTAKPHQNKSASQDISSSVLPSRSKTPHRSPINTPHSNESAYASLEARIKAIEQGLAACPLIANPTAPTEVLDRHNYLEQRFETTLSRVEVASASVHPSPQLFPPSSVKHWTIVWHNASVTWIIRVAPVAPAACVVVAAPHLRIGLDEF